MSMRNDDAHRAGDDRHGDRAEVSRPLQGIVRPTLTASASLEPRVIGVLSRRILTRP